MSALEKKHSSRVKGATDVDVICTLPELAALADAVPENNAERRMADRNGKEWCGGTTYATATEHVKTGDLAGVPASDKILDKIETETFVSRVWENKNDVVGGVPNVPAYLAGHPLTMRRRERVLSEQGPLSIFVSLELSAAIDAETMRKRGVAMLALVRLLSNVRPVTLWAVCAVGNSKTAVNILTRIDTSPLDLARAAHVLTNPCVTRGLCLAIADEMHKKHFGSGWYGGWAYGSHDTYRTNARETFRAAVADNGEALLIPAAHKDDQCVNDPIAWLKLMLAQYGGAQVAE
jgi:hypothetical protein